MAGGSLNCPYFQHPGLYWDAGSAAGLPRPRCPHAHRPPPRAAPTTAPPPGTCPGGPPGHPPAHHALETAVTPQAETPAEARLHAPGPDPRPARTRGRPAHTRDGSPSQLFRPAPRTRAATLTVSGDADMQSPAASARAPHSTRRSSPRVLRSPRGLVRQPPAHARAH